MFHRRLSLIVLPLAVLAAGCTVNPRPVVVTTPTPVVQATTPPAVVMGAPANPIVIDVPAGFYPAPGNCRIWRPGVAATQQDLPGSCSDLMNRVPAGAVLLRG